MMTASRIRTAWYSGMSPPPASRNASSSPNRVETGAHEPVEVRELLHGARRVEYPCRTCGEVTLVVGEGERPRAEARANGRPYRHGDLCRRTELRSCLARRDGRLLGAFGVVGRSARRRGRSGRLDGKQLGHEARHAGLADWAERERDLEDLLEVVQRRRLPDLCGIDAVRPGTRCRRGIGGAVPARDSGRREALAGIGADLRQQLGVMEPERLQQPAWVDGDDDDEERQGQDQVHRLEHLDDPARRAAIEVVDIEDDPVDHREIGLLRGGRSAGGLPVPAVRGLGHALPLGREDVAHPREVVVDAGHDPEL